MLYIQLKVKRTSALNVWKQLP